LNTSVIALCILAVCPLLEAQTFPPPLILTESGDFPSHYPAGVYGNIGTLGLGTNIISGSVSGQAQGTNYLGDFDDSFSLTLPTGLQLTKIQLTLTNYSLGFGTGACAIDVNGVSPSGVFGLPSMASPKCLSGATTTFTYTFPNDYSTQTPGTFPVYLASPYNPARLQAGGFSYSLLLTTTGPSTPITITTPPTLPFGSLGTIYAQSLKATGGFVYTWQLLSGALPQGLALTTGGVIAGTPTVTGTSVFTLRAIDNETLQSASQVFSLTVTTQVDNFGAALRIPHLVEGAGWKTLFAIVNIDTQPSTYNFHFWAGDGSVLALPILGGQPGVLTGTLAPGATVFAETPGTSDQQIEGWAEVASSGRLGVTAIFRFTGSGTDLQGTSNGAVSGSSIFMPFDNTQGYVTGLALVNANPTKTLNVTLSFLTDAGVPSSFVVVLPPHGHKTYIMPTAFPALAGQRGSLNVTATTPDIALLGLRFTPSLSFTSLGAFQ